MFTGAKHIDLRVCVCVLVKYSKVNQDDLEVSSQNDPDRTVYRLNTEVTVRWDTNNTQELL